MSEFETLVGLLLVAVILAAVARKVGAPYPAFVALGGAVLASVPGAPTFAIEPDLAISWSGMRGIVSLAAALALPFHVGAAPFPFRDLIVFTAFSVVLGTLVIQGLSACTAFTRSTVNVTAES